MVGLVKMIKLGSKRLVLPHGAGRDNGASFGQLVELFDNELRFDDVLLFIGKGLGAFPILDLIQPIPSGGLPDRRIGPASASMRLSSFNVILQSPTTGVDTFTGTFFRIDVGSMSI